MKVALFCLLVLPISSIFGRQTLDLTFTPQSGYYKSVYAYQANGLYWESELKADLKKDRFEARLAQVSYQGFSYTESRSLDGYHFLPGQEWRSFAYDRPNISVSLMSDGDAQQAVRIKAGSFTALYLDGPDAVHLDDFALVWDRHLLGRNLLVQYCFESEAASCLIEGLWGEYRSFTLFTSMALNVGPVQLECSFNGSSFLRKLGAGIQVKKPGFVLRHTLSSQLGLMPIHSGHSQTMHTVLSTEAQYLCLGMGYEQIFWVDEMGKREKERELSLFFKGSAMQIGLVFSSDVESKMLLDSSQSRLSYQSSNLSAVFVFQRRSGSVTLRFDPRKGLSITYALRLAIDRRSESPPPA